MNDIELAELQRQQMRRQRVRMLILIPLGVLLSMVPVLLMVLVFRLLSS